MWFAGHWPAWEVPLTSWPRKPAMPWPTSVGARMMPRARTMTTVIFSSNRLRASVRRRSRRTTMTARSTATLIVSKASSPPSDLSGAAGDSPRVSCVAGGQRCCDQIVRDWRQCAAMAGFRGADVRETRVRQGPGAAAGHLRLHRPDGPPFRGRKWADETHSDRRGGVGQFSRGTFGCARLGLVVGVPVSGCRTRARCASRSSRSSSAGVTNGARWRAAVWARRRRSRFRIAAIVCVLVGNWSARKLVGQPCSASFCRLVAALSASTRPGSSRSRRRAVFSGMPRMAPAVVRWIRAGRASAERSRRRTRVTATPDVSAMSAADPTAHVVGPPEHAAVTSG